MRPIDKGSWPIFNNGNFRNFNDWKRGSSHLVQRTGDYCHFCEMRVNNCLAIEHIKCRKFYPKLSNNWHNFLLVCTSCNSNKKDKKLTPPYRKNYYWPHFNNTLLAFSSPLIGPTRLLVKPKSGLASSQRIQAVATIDLYGLNKAVTSTGNSDKRFIERKKTAKMAIDRLLEFHDGKTTVPAIVDMATTTGFFSVWLDIFNNVPAVKQALVNAPEFKLNVPAWFNAQLDPLPRNPSQADPI